MGACLLRLQYQCGSEPMYYEGARLGDGQLESLNIDMCCLGSHLRAQYEPSFLIKLGPV